MISLDGIARKLRLDRFIKFRSYLKPFAANHGAYVFKRDPSDLSYRFIKKGRRSPGKLHIRAINKTLACIGDVYIDGSSISVDNQLMAKVGYR